MNHTLTRRAGLLGATLLLVACAGMPGASGWTTLVDGTKGLENFDQIGDANWRAEGNSIVADKAKGSSFLVSKKSYKDFELRAEFWADHHTNSGIYFRLSDPKVVSQYNAYEANIYDQRPDPVYGTGAIVDFAKVSPMPKAGGKWNTYVVTARGTSVVVVFNGVQTVHMTDSKFSSGPIALQFGNGPKDAPGGAIKWRKVEIREL